MKCTFAIAYHKQLRSKGMTKSILEDIPGIGPARQKTLKTKFPSMKKMKEASLDDFEQLVPAQSARILYERLHEGEES